MITRSLRYPRGWPTVPAQEKGIDVALAVDFVKLAVEGDYDVGVMLSTDNDLLPALEVVAATTRAGSTSPWPPGALHDITNGCASQEGFGATGWTRPITTPWPI